MSLRLYNTLTRNLEELQPRKPGRVAMYCCGPTVYDVPHAGHARAALAPDILVRRLRTRGLEVTYVRNITDVDDKILNRAAERGEDPLVLSQRMALVYQEQMRALGCLSPEQEPKVSEHLPQIIAMVEQLIARGHAYAVERPDGQRDVYYAVRSFTEYGKLSRRRIDDLMVGARIEKDELKRDPLDFALWKGALASEWGWDSPWGRGRPGWHIECSAMGKHYLGELDVHAGGMDLIFPHHENEIAQSEAAHPECAPYATCWMHNGFVNVDKEKMSKSLGNFVTLADVLERNDPEAFRYFLLSVHYRGPIQFDTNKLEDGRVVFPGVDEAEGRVDYLYAALRRLAEIGEGGMTVPAKLPPELVGYRDSTRKAVAEAEKGLDEDLNTPIALASLGELARLGNELGDLALKRRKDKAFGGSAALVAREVADSLRELARQLGLLQASAPEYAGRTRERRLRLRGLSVAQIDGLVAERTAARAAKDFARSDALRDELVALGVVLKDSAEGTQWFLGA
jgi:cysteinyl-tRNA synthetase